MKKLLLIAALFTGFSANAQIEKGKTALWGGLSYETGKLTSPSFAVQSAQSETKATEFSINAGVGKFITNRLLLGVYGGYTHQNATQTNIANSNYFDKLEANTYTIGIEAKWYKKISSRFYYNINGMISYEKAKGSETQTYPGYNYSYNTTGKTTTIQVQPVQITYAISKKFLAEAGFGSVQFAKVKTESSAYYSGSQSQQASLFGISLSPIVSAVTFTYIF